MIDRINMVTDGEPIFYPILEEIIKIIQNIGNIGLIDMLIAKLKSIITEN